jgi:hypothetical protein
MQHFLEVSFPDFPVHRIDPGSVDSDQCFPVAWMWARRIFINEAAGAAGGIDADRLHGFHA